MDEFGGFSAMRQVEVDLLTAGYRVSGVVQTRFARVADIVNQQSGTHLTVEHATISEHADPTATVAVASCMVAISSILLLTASALTGEASSEMRIPKRAVKAQLAIPPVRVTGAIHVPMGSRPSDGLLNVPDRFLAMTDATISCGAYPELARNAPAVAVCRDHAELILVTDDERPDQLLADVLDERTAGSWLHREDAPR